MSEWFYSKNNEQHGPVSEMELREKIKSGGLLKSSLVWREGMEKWTPAGEVFSDLGGYLEETAVCAVSGKTLPLSQMLQYGDRYVSPDHKDEFVSTLQSGGEIAAPTGLNNTSGYVFANPRGRALAVKILFAIGFVFEMATTGFDLFTSDPNDPNAYNIFDALMGISAFLFLGVYIAGIVLFCMWKVRVCRNAHVLSDRPMEFTPGWSVGFYFIPIVMLWKPFQAMREIWNVTFKRDSGAGAPAIIGWWWFCWIASNVLGQISFRTAMNGLMDASRVADWINVAVSIPLLILVIKIVDGITDKQVERAKAEQLI